MGWHVSGESESMNTANGNIPNHMVWTIVSTVIATLTCCPLGLLGIVGIVNSDKVNKLLAAGDAAGAMRASSTAKTWAIVATVLAVLGIIINIWWRMSGGQEAMMEQLQQMQQMQGQ